jgi:hypothetical protein
MLERGVVTRVRKEPRTFRSSINHMEHQATRCHAPSPRHVTAASNGNAVVTVLYK